MSEEEKRKKRCSFTGHRPEKIRQSESFVVKMIKQEIYNAIEDGFDVFITGMARGVDIWAAEIIIDIRNTKKLPLKLIAAVPYYNFEKTWSLSWQKRYSYVIKQADLVRFLAPKYHKNCFKFRNEWLVDHSARVIAIFSGEKGGTKNTIDYALARGVSVKKIFIS